MSEPSYIGILHNSDGLSFVGPDGFTVLFQTAAELEVDERAALDTPVIDVAPESVTDKEIERS